MNPVEAKRAVVFSLFGAGAILVVSHTVTKGFPTDPRLYIAAAFLYIVLGFSAEFAPQVAGPFAILIFVAILLYQGAPAFDGVLLALNRKKGKGKK